ncbi:pro-interleukin-16 [Poecilia reticulata]|uniref:pro-interleukin-16 n=1 Tax=Poecilia reticulata TaxID=8081 RepID=UPI0007EACFAA|nr:PREDICTED: pro-interleukin-16-like [Poecilia reticulata]
MEGCEDDDESTQKDDDSDDSDSGDSSATITSNTSQSENRSFSLSFLLTLLLHHSLSNLCYFSGTDVESDYDNDDWQLPGRRSASLSSDVSAFSCVSLLPSDELDKLVEEVKNLGEETLQDYDDVQVVVLHKEVGVGLGFSLAGGVDQNKPVTVHKVFNSGVAAQEGSISEGDHVLSINGTAFSKSTHGEALRTLKKAKSREMAVVVVRKGDLSQTETHYETGQRVCIQLEKNSGDLGFSLKGGEDSHVGNKPLTVQKIFQGGPVDKVFPGDEILEIQGFSVVGRRRLEVWNFIKTLASGPVEVVLRRPLKVTQL